MSAQAGPNPTIRYAAIRLRLVEEQAKRIKLAQQILDLQNKAVLFRLLKGK